MPFQDDDYPRLDPREFPEPDDSGTETMPCPHCLAVIYDDSERCPACGQYLSATANRSKPLWIVFGIILCLALSLYWILP